jgi:hypothetical protein
MEAGANGKENGEPMKNTRIGFCQNEPNFAFSQVGELAAAA